MAADCAAAAGQGRGSGTERCRQPVVRERSAAGAQVRRPPAQSAGALTTKIHMLTDTLGRPLRFLLAAGQSHDILAAPLLLQGYSIRPFSPTVPMTPPPCATSSPTSAPGRSFLPPAPGQCPFRTIPSSIDLATASSDASTSSSTPDASQPATTDAISTSSASSNSPPQ